LPPEPKREDKSPRSIEGSGDDSRKTSENRTDRSQISKNSIISRGSNRSKVTNKNKGM